MTTKRSDKDFDCVEFKRRVQEEMYRETRDMTPEEEIAWYRERAETGALGDWWREIVRVTEERRAGRAGGKAA
jgi:hypothetical protein